MNLVEKKLAELRKSGAVANMDQHAQVRTAKAYVHADAERELPLRFTYEGVHITVHAVSVFRDGLRVDLTASVPVRGPFLFVNPPTQVKDGTDDADAAFREMVGRAVAFAARPR